MFYQHHMDAGGWVFMALGNIIIWGLIIAFVLWLLQDLRTRPHRHHITSGASASEILDRRLATGQLTPGRYRQLRTTLATKSGEPRPPEAQELNPDPAPLDSSRERAVHEGHRAALENAVAVP